VRRTLGLLVLALAISGCRHAREVIHAGDFRGAPVVLVSIDTLRADHLPVYGYAAGSTPTLDRLAQSGIVFDDAYSHTPLTLPSHASILTGRLPFHHGVRDNIGYALPAGERTLAERFRAAGYATGAAVSAYVLRRQTGINRGFEFFDDRLEIAGTGESLSDTQRDGKLTVDALSAWIDARSTRPLFAFLHLYEPHTPYSPPPSHAMAQPYDGEIAYADELVGRLFDRLAVRGLFDRAVVAVVSDHGEGLGDHGEAEHGIFLYRESLRVPWILRLPGGRNAGTRIRGPVGLVDVAATLLDLTGVEPGGGDGASLVASLGSGVAADRTIYSETQYPRLHFGWSDLASATGARYRLIRAPRRELYDISNDPTERRNIAPAMAATASALDGWLERATSGSVVAAPKAVPSRVRERLNALGYVGSAPSPDPGNRSPLADPKDKIAAYEALRRAQTLTTSGRDADAAIELERLVADEPRMLDAWELLAKTRIKLGRTKDGLQAFGRVLEIDPLKPETHLAIARILALERQPAQAREHAELAVERDPAAAYELLAELAMDAGRPAEASALAKRSIDEDASRYMSHFILGVVAHREGRCADAIPAFERAIDAKRSEPHAVVRNLHAELADCLARSGRAADAEREFEAELADIPASPEARVGLATLYRSQGRDDDARRTLGGIVTAAPEPTADSYWTVIRSFNVLGDAQAAREWTSRAHDRFPSDLRFRNR
jgi:choline-sulfatase